MIFIFHELLFKQNHFTFNYVRKIIRANEVEIGKREFTLEASNDIFVHTRIHKHSL